MLNVKGKGIPLQITKVHGRCGCKSPHIAYIATALGRGRVASPMLDRLYPQEKLPVLIL